MTNEYITLKDLSVELGMDRSNLRKYALSLGLAPIKVRTAKSHNQAILALVIKDAELLCQSRDDLGYSKVAPISDNGNGFFYVIRLVPDLDPCRVKLGFASDVKRRLSAHKTAAPTAELVKCWPCKRVWEIAAMDSLTRAGCELIAGEVYTCEDVDGLARRGNEFFEVMPCLEKVSDGR